MLIFVLVVAVIFIGWHFLPPSKPPAPQPRFRQDFRIRAGQKDWRQFVEEHCESPAESKFLGLLIEAYDLSPQIGSLHGRGLQLDFQVGEGPYRVDFLANKWLVIEIDGAAYHGSPKAQALDRIRDKYFEELGYSVIRIPAKVVFERPNEALSKFRSALALGKRQVATTPPVSGLKRLGQTASDLADGINELGAIVSRHRAVDEALSEPRAVAAQEREILQIAIRSAERELEFESLPREARTRLEQFRAEFREAVPVSDAVAVHIPEFPPMPSHQDPSTANHIHAAYKSVADERRRLFEETHRKIEEVPRLGPLVEQQLAKFGCSLLLTRIY